MSTLTLRALCILDVGPIDLSVGEGECVCLWGASGTGKTLVLRACADLDAHDGEVLLDELSQAEVPAPRWRAQVGLLPAESHWWGERVGEHFGDLDAAMSVERLGLPGDVLTWPVERLSTGERSRLAVARLLVRQPKALLLDEPTAHLDPESTALVEAAVADYRERRGAAVLWVSHDEAQRGRVASSSHRISGGRLEA